MLTDNLLESGDENIIIKKSTSYDYDDISDDDVNNDIDTDADDDTFCDADNRLCHADIAFQMKRLVIQGKCSLTDNCTICLEDMHRSKCIYLPCKHVFHSKCLHQLVERRIDTCPLCRAGFKDYLSVLRLPRSGVGVVDDHEQIELIITIQNELADALLYWLRQSYEGEYELLE